ncbi:hypothetical protein TSUD_15400 [Trifolium subterraneum]|uniref:Uncharacterized protein n=1 Tax=Trifolium subterraneum TaxID=3900 RepID=A0A2Z6MDU3_TRISU|nr:hypothetical protein TSUD_15400 [Trifolium subterraneum]
MGKKEKKEKAKERREKRLQDIQLLRSIPYSDQQSFQVGVNNAGVNFNLGSDNSVENAHKVIKTNYYGTKNITEALIPLMKPSIVGARIVNVSSRLGRLNGRRNRISNVALREQLSDVECFSEELIDRTLSSFLQQVEDGSWPSGGWPQNYTDYSVSKLAVNAYTRLTARKLSERPEGQKIYINCCCPGWVKTALTGFAGNNTVEEGADTGVWLALLHDQIFMGRELLLLPTDCNTYCNCHVSAIGHSTIFIGQILSCHNLSFTIDNKHILPL